MPLILGLGGQQKECDQGHNPAEESGDGNEDEWQLSRI